MDFLAISLDADPSMIQARDEVAAGLEARPLVRELIGKLAEARSERDYATADRIRDGFSEAGLTLAYNEDGSVTLKRERNFDLSKLEALR